MMASSPVRKHNADKSTDSMTAMSKTVPSNIEDKLFHCVACSRDFKSNNALKLHLKKSRAHKSGPIFTSSKTTTFGRVKEKDPVLFPSSGPVNYDQNRGFACNICHKRFGGQGALDMHFLDIHSKGREHTNNSRPTNVSRYTVKTHSKHMGPKEMSFTNQPNSELTSNLFCAPCDRPFSTENGFNLHIETSKEHKAILAATRQETKTYPSSKAGRDGIVSQETSVLLSTRSASDGTLNQPVSLRAPLALAHQHNSGPSSIGGDPTWTKISGERHTELMNSLSRLCHDQRELKKVAYRLHECTPNEIDGYRKCKKCKGYQKDLRKGSQCFRHPEKKETRKKIVQGKEVMEEVYSCCGRQGRGCFVSAEHEFGPPDTFRTSLLEQYRLTPEPEFSDASKRWAVTLDCEMVGVQSGLSEVIRLCAVDFFTGEVLIDSLVVPNERVTQWRTRYSGVTRQMLIEAERRGKALRGWLAAREALYKYIDSETILIGQSLQNDLLVLRMVHTMVVDSAILTKNIVDEDCPRQWGLKTLCKDLLGAAIQRGKAGHDCLEDTFAAREIVLLCIEEHQKVEAWAKIQREEIRKEREERQRLKEEKEKEKAAAATKKLEKAEKKGETDGDQEKDDDNAEATTISQTDGDLLIFDDDAGDPVPVS